MPQKLNSWRISFFIILILGVLSIFFILQKTNVPVEREIEENTVETADAIRETCSNNQNWSDCYGNELKNLLKTEGIDSVLKVMSRIQETDPKTLDCHILAHYLASAQIERDPLSWKGFLKEIDLSSCNYGFIHGVLEGLSSQDENFEITPENVSRICSEISGGESIPSEKGCAHAMGHLALADNCSDDINVSIEKAVGICSRTQSILQHECYAGIFMESFTRDNLNSHCGTPKVDWTAKPIIYSQEKLCESYEGTQVASSCWQEISHMYVALYPKNPAVIFTSCQKALTDKDSNYCYMHAVGSLLTDGESSSKYLSSICRPYGTDTKKYQECIKFTVEVIITRSAKYADLAKLFCQSQPPLFQNDCLSTLNKLLKVRDNHEK